mgnify:CR=1 FL=1
MRSVASLYAETTDVFLRTICLDSPPGILFDYGCECLRRLERRNLASWYDDRRLLGYVASSLLCALLDDKATEASEVDIVSLAHSVLDCIHKSLYDL